MPYRTALFVALGMVTAAGSADAQRATGSTCKGKLVGEFHVLGEGDVPNSTTYEVMVSNVAQERQTYRLVYSGFPRGFTVFRPIGGSVMPQDPATHPVGYSVGRVPLTPAQVQIAYEVGSANGPTIAIIGCAPARRSRIGRG